MFGMFGTDEVRTDESIIASAQAAQARMCQSARILCENAEDIAKSLKDAQEQLARKRAKVHSLTQDKEQLIKEKADLLEQNRKLILLLTKEKAEVAHLTQQVLAQADTNAQATIDAINTTNAETPAISDTENIAG